MNERIELKAGTNYFMNLPGGHLDIYANVDPQYPGLDIEYVPNAKPDDENPVTNPRVVLEQPIEDDDVSFKSLRTLIWADPHGEDYSDKIEFTNTEGSIPPATNQTESTFIVKSDVSSKKFTIAHDHASALLAFYRAALDFMVEQDEEYLLYDQPYAAQMRAAIGDTIDAYENGHVPFENVKRSIENWIGDYTKESVMPALITDFCATHEGTYITSGDDKTVSKRAMPTKTSLQLRCYDEDGDMIEVTLDDSSSIASYS